MFWVLGPEVCGILASLPGIEPTSPALEGKVLTTGVPGRSQESQFFFFFVVNFVIHWNETAMGLHVFPIPIPPPTSLSTRSL